MRTLRWLFLKGIIFHDTESFNMLNTIYLSMHLFSKRILTNANNKPIRSTFTEIKYIINIGFYNTHTQIELNVALIVVKGVRIRNINLIICFCHPKISWE